MNSNKLDILEYYFAVQQKEFDIPTQRFIWVDVATDIQSFERANDIRKAFRKYKKELRIIQRHDTIVIHEA